MLHDGVVEHNFIQQTNLGDGYINQKDICIALLDLSNAFSSIPIRLILSSPDGSRIGKDISIITDMSGMKTSITRANGTTEELDENSGVLPTEPFPFSTLESNLSSDHWLQQAKN